MLTTVQLCHFKLLEFIVKFGVLSKTPE